MLLQNHFWLVEVDKKVTEASYFSVNQDNVMYFGSARSRSYSPSYTLEFSTSSEHNLLIPSIDNVHHTYHRWLSHWRYTVVRILQNSSRCLEEDTTCLQMYID